MFTFTFSIVRRRSLGTSIRSRFILLLLLLLGSTVASAIKIYILLFTPYLILVNAKKGRDSWLRWFNRFLSELLIPHIINNLNVRHHFQFSNLNNHFFLLFYMSVYILYQVSRKYCHFYRSKCLKNAHSSFSCRK